MKKGETQKRFERKLPGRVAHSAATIRQGDILLEKSRFPLALLAIVCEVRDR